MVSKNLLHPGATQELAHGVNILCAAWIQFQVHDWFEHRKDQENRVRLEATDALPELDIASTPIAPGTEELPLPIYENQQGHWWDGSQIYGSSEKIATHLRECGGTGARLRLVADTDSAEPLLPWEPPLDEHGVTDQNVESSGFIKNWWFGLSALHTLFAREHNAIVTMLEGTDQYQRVPESERDEWLFQTARLINGALMAKIHTVEWTTTLLGDRMIQLGLLLDWWGINVDELKLKLPQLSKLPADHLWQLLAQAIERDADGIAQMVVDNQPAARHAPSPVEKMPRIGTSCSPCPKSLYRFIACMPFLREETPIHTLNGDQPETVSLRNGSFEHARPLVEKHGLANLFLTLGREETGGAAFAKLPEELCCSRCQRQPKPDRSRRSRHSSRPRTRRAALYDI